MLSAADDWLILDWSFGSPIPAGGLSFDGKAGGGDVVSFVGTTAADVITFAANKVTVNGTNILHANVERLTFDGRGGADEVNVTGGAPVTLSLAAPAVGLARFQLSGGAKAALYTGGAARALFVDGAGFTIDATSTLDLGDNALVVRNGGAGSAGQAVARRVAGYLKSGLENGGNFDWLGNGIGSTGANATAGSVLYGVGVLQNNVHAAGPPTARPPTKRLAARSSRTLAAAPCR